MKVTLGPEIPKALHDIKVFGQGLYMVALAIYFIFIYLLFLCTRQRWLSVLIPVWLWRVPPALTSRSTYNDEKLSYRLYHQMSNDGWIRLKRPYYYYYRYIARKYNWPYIKESFDNDLYN
jgi:hypothetical protein